MNKIAIYLRLSIDDGSHNIESNSITNQRFLIKEFIYNQEELRNCRIVEYSDDGYSGTNFERPGITKLLEEVKKNVIDCIIVKDFSRFSRDYIEMGSYINQIFPFMGIRFISINDNYDSKGHRGATAEIDTAFKTLLYDFYSKDISAKSKASILSKCAHGEYVFGQVPFGYEKDPNHKNTISINKNEASVVKHIFEMSAAGMSTVQIEKQLHKEGVPTIREMRQPHLIDKEKVTCWHNSMINRIIKNRFYIGEWTYNKTKTKTVGSKKKIQRPKEDWITISDHHDYLVSKELFQAAQIPKSGASTKRKYPKHPLTGRLYCGGCGYSMSFKRVTKRLGYSRFECRKHAQLQIQTCCTCFQADVLEELVLSMLNQELLKLSELEASKETLGELLKVNMSKIKSDIRGHKNQIERLEGEKQALYESYSMGNFTSTEYVDLAAKIEGRMKQENAEMEKSEDRLVKVEEQYFANADNLKQFFRKIDMKELTEELVDTFISKIKVYKDKRIEIEWSFSFPVL